MPDKSEDCVLLQDETLPGDPVELSNHEFSSIGLENCDNMEPVESPVLVQQKPSDESKPKVAIKGFRREKSIGIICLDCGKCFKQKNTYNYHKRR